MSLSLVLTHICVSLLLAVELFMDGLTVEWVVRHCQLCVCVCVCHHHHELCLKVKSVLPP